MRTPALQGRPVGAHAGVRLASVAVACVILAGGARTLAAQAKAPPDPTLAAADRGRIMGSPGAKLWMLVVSDFQCPFCKSWHDSTWTTIRREYVDAGKLRVAFLNFPLSIHRNARPAAAAAMCASAQGKFWPMADALFASQRQWETLANPGAFFTQLAKATGVDVAAQEACVRGPAIATLVAADQARMSRAGVESTPTFFIGESKIEGAYPLVQFRRVIDAELAGHRP